MKRLFSHSLLLVISLSVLASNIEAAPAGLTEADAITIVEKYSRKSAERGGLCLIGIRSETKIEPSQPVIVEGSKIKFIGYYAKLTGISSISPTILLGPLPGTVTLDYKAKLRNSEVDVTKLKRLQVFKRIRGLKSHCTTAKGDYLVGLTPKEKLPDAAELLMDVRNDAEVDELLPALKYFSPKAKVKDRR